MKVKPGDTIELTEDITGGVRKGDRFQVDEVLSSMSFYSVSIRVPHLINGYTQAVLLRSEEFKVINE